MGFLDRLHIGRNRASGALGAEGQVLACKLFLHIPKTAGTSFRRAAADRFGAERILKDYGPDAAETSEILRKTVLESGDPVEIIRVARQTKAAMLTGHLNVTRYMGIFGLLNTVTLLREPVARVVSHFRHAVRHLGFEGSIMHFAEQPQFRDLQARLVARLDPALFGLVGTTERYDDFLAGLEHAWGWSLDGMKVNVGDELGKLRVSLSDAEQEKIRNWNSMDYRLYDKAQRVMSNSAYCREQGIRFEPRGGLKLERGRDVLGGWSFNLGSGEAARVTVTVNGEHRADVECASFVPGAACWKAPRHGYIGFRLRQADLHPGDIVELRDHSGALMLDRAIAS
jgi:hypothetical protein